MSQVMGQNHGIVVMSEGWLMAGRYSASGACIKGLCCVVVSAAFTPEVLPPLMCSPGSQHSVICEQADLFAAQPSKLHDFLDLKPDNPPRGFGL